LLAKNPTTKTIRNNDTPPASLIACSIPSPRSDDVAGVVLSLRCIGDERNPSKYSFVPTLTSGGGVRSLLSDDSESSSSLSLVPFMNNKLVLRSCCDDKKKKNNVREDDDDEERRPDQDLLVLVCPMSFTIIGIIDIGIVDCDGLT